MHVPSTEEADALVIGYRQIADILRARIDRGDFTGRQGSPRKLPTQVELAEEFRVSRVTIRRAIDLLESEGRVNPTQGHGTYVREIDRVPLPQDRYVKATPTAGPWQTACGMHGETGLTVVTGVHRREVDDWIAEVLELRTGEPVILRQNHMIRVKNNKIVQTQDVWLPEWVAADTPLAEPAKIDSGIYGGLAAAGQRAVAAVETVIGRPPTPQERQVFGLRDGSPVLDSQRVARNVHGEPVVFTQLVSAGDHVSLVFSQVL